MNLFRIWKDLTASERSQVIWTLIIGLASVTIILYAFLVSRGHDIDYFKDRLSLMEQRINYMDQKIDKTNENAAESKRLLDEVRRIQDQQLREQEDNRKWIEHWKTLPQLPKPSQRR